MRAQCQPGQMFERIQLKKIRITETKSKNEMEKNTEIIQAGEKK